MTRLPARTPSQWARLITDSWQNSLRSILAVGKLLTSAKEAMEHGQWEAMCESKLPFTSRTARMLMAIAADPRLTNRKHVSVLPPSWGTLYELTKLKDDEFVARVKDGTIRADMERREIAQIVKAERRADREQTLGAKQTALPDEKFGVIVADPEWQFEPWSRLTGMDRAADNHYPTSCLDVIKSRDVPSIAADDCLLGLWATIPMLPHALAVMAAWGVDYKSHYVWGKNKQGTGYWNFEKHELFLIGTRGDIPCPSPGTQRESLIVAPRGRHSEKPECFLEMIEGWFPNLPKIELNRRGPARPGWSAWGNEA